MKKNPTQSEITIDYLNTMINLELEDLLIEIMSGEEKADIVNEFEKWLKGEKNEIA